MLNPDRRRFLRDAACLGAGAIAASWWPSWRYSTSHATAADAAPSAEQRVKDLGLDIKAPASGNKMILPAVRVGNTLYVSGHIPMTADGMRIVGKVGKDMDTKQAVEAARAIALTILGVVRAELGSLDKVVRLVKVLGMVNCTPEFAETPQVINGFSQVMIDVFGEQAGRGARSAVGMASLPGGVSVEVEAIFQVRD